MVKKVGGEAERLTAFGGTLLGSSFDGAVLACLLLACCFKPASWSLSCLGGFLDCYVRAVVAHARAILTYLWSRMVEPTISDQGADGGIGEREMEYVLSWDSIQIQIHTTWEGPPPGCDPSPIPCKLRLSGLTCLFAYGISTGVPGLPSMVLIRPNHIYCHCRMRPYP